MTDTLSFLEEWHQLKKSKYWPRSLCTNFFSCRYFMPHAIWLAHRGISKSVLTLSGCSNKKSSIEPTIFNTIIEEIKTMNNDFMSSPANENILKRKRRWTVNNYTVIYNNLSCSMDGSEIIVKLCYSKHIIFL